MTFDEYWRRIITANPPLDREGVVCHITAFELQQQLRKAFNVGRDSEAEPKYKNVKNPFPDIFNSLFRGGM